MMRGLVTDAFRWWVKARPDAPALSLDDETLTYRELDIWTDQVADALRKRGVGKGSVVGIGGVNTIEWCVAAVSCLKIGAILAPFSYRFTPREISMMIDDCAPMLILTDATQRQKLVELLENGKSFEIHDLETLRGMKVGETKCPPLEADPALPIAIVYTSGTTGRPKGVIYTHQSTLSFITEILFKEPMAPDDFRLLFVLPLFTMGGLFHILLHALSRGGWATLTRSFSPADALNIMVERRISYMPGVPGIWEQISLLPDFQNSDLSHLRFATVGGARVSPKLLQAYFERGVSLRHIYGMTEIGGYGTLPRQQEAQSQPETCGDGSMFTQFRVTREDGTSTEPNEVGQILLRGPAMMPGYWGNDEATKNLIVDGWIYTGDLGSIDGLGRLTFVDRKKDMIISGGFNISPMEIENVILEHPGIEEVVVIPVPDPRFGETPAAIIHVKGELNIPRLMQSLKTKLADYKVPRYVVPCQEPLPRMLSGKIARRQLLEEYATIPERFERVR
jgi:fatty-acyl-CoA synthase